jgi:hypothetical protein
MRLRHRLGVRQRIERDRAAGSEAADARDVRPYSARRARDDPPDDAAQSRARTARRAGFDTPPAGQTAGVDEQESRAGGHLEAVQLDGEDG